MKKNLPNFISFPPKEEETENYNINLLEKNVYFDENIYFIHYLSNSRKMDFNDPINKKRGNSIYNVPGIFLFIF